MDRKSMRHPPLRRSSTSVGLNTAVPARRYIATRDGRYTLERRVMARSDMSHSASHNKLPPEGKLSDIKRPNPHPVKHNGGTGTSQRRTTMKELDRMITGKDRPRKNALSEVADSSLQDLAAMYPPSEQDERDRLLANKVVSFDDEGSVSEDEPIRAEHRCKLVSDEVYRHFEPKTCCDKILLFIMGMSEVLDYFDTVFEIDE